MEKTTSQKALKVVSIIMIVFAALTLLIGIASIVGGGAIGMAGAGSNESDLALVGGLAVAAGLIVLLGGCIDLLIGIFGLRGANDPRKIGAFYVLAIIGLVFAVLSALGTLFAGSADGSDIVSALVGLLLPAVCVLLAYNIKKENSL